MVDQRPDGTVTWFEPEGFGDEDRPWLQVWSPDGQLLYQSSEAPQRCRCRTARSLALRPTTGSHRGRGPTTAPVRVLSNSGTIARRSRRQPVVIQVARTEAPMRQQLQRAGADPRARLAARRRGRPASAATTLARPALAPVERMTERARTITAERLSDRLPVDNPDDELGRLATVFNETLGRLEASFEQMRRFTADVSHELRTPLTAIRSVGEVGLREHRDEPRVPRDHRQHARGSRSAVRVWSIAC